MIKMMIAFRYFCSQVFLRVGADGSSSARRPGNIKGVNITGTVTCTKYVNSKPDRKGFTAAEAIRLCASQGYAYVIVSGKNVYPLEGDKTQMAKLAGEKVTVTGHVITDRPEGATEAYQGTVAWQRPSFLRQIEDAAE